MEGKLEEEDKNCVKTETGAGNPSYSREIIPLIVPSQERPKPQPRPDLPGPEVQLSQKERKIWQKVSFVEKKFLKGMTIMAAAFFLASIFLSRAVFAERNAETYTKAAKDNLLSSLDALGDGNFQEAFTELNLASENLTKLKVILQSFGQDIKYPRFISGNRSQIISLERILDISLETLNLFKLGDKDYLELSKGMAKSNDYIFDLGMTRNNLLRITNRAKVNLTNSKVEIEKISDSIPVKYQPEVYKIINSMQKVLDSSSAMNELLSRDLSWLSGEDGRDKKILIIFQNNAELRGGSGGSFGSFGVAKFSQGKLLNIDFGSNIFKLDSAFIQKECIPLNNELKFVVTDGCQKLKDSGWAVDGPEALQNIKLFYNKVTGDSIDGIITIDASAILKLLEVVGPIRLPQYNEVIDSTNFRSVIEKEVHQDYFTRPGGKEENEPKKILSEMMPVFIEKLTMSLTNPDKFMKVAGAFAQALKEKSILFYFSDASLSAKIEKFNLGGGIKKAVGDYLYINNSNINGFKSSISMNQKIMLSVDISAEGAIANSIELVREHTGSAAWPDGLNRNFVRLLLPEKTILTEFKPISGNFERYYDQGYKDGRPSWQSEEGGKKVLNFWMNTEPEASSAVGIKYIPNYRVSTEGDFNYELLLQRQPGANPDQIELVINYPYGFKPTNITNYDFINHKLILKINLISDQTIKINFSKLKNEETK